MNTFFRIRCLGVLNAAMLGLLCQLAWANPECIVAAKPGGGMDVSCKLLQKPSVPWHGARTCIELFTGWHWCRGLEFGRVAPSWRR